MIRNERFALDSVHFEKNVTPGVVEQHLRASHCKAPGFCQASFTDAYLGALPGLSFCDAE